MYVRYLHSGPSISIDFPDLVSDLLREEARTSLLLVAQHASLSHPSVLREQVYLTQPRLHAHEKKKPPQIKQRANIQYSATQIKDEFPNKKTKKNSLIFITKVNPRLAINIEEESINKFLIK